MRFTDSPLLRISLSFNRLAGKSSHVYPSKKKRPIKWASNIFPHLFPEVSVSSWGIPPFVIYFEPWDVPQKTINFLGYHDDGNTHMKPGFLGHFLAGKKKKNDSQRSPWRSALWPNHGAVLGAPKRGSFKGKCVEDL